MITRRDLATIILSIKKQMGWTYEVMAQKTNIVPSLLYYYASMRKFPKDPDKVVCQIQNAAKKEAMKRRGVV